MPEVVIFIFAILFAWLTYRRLDWAIILIAGLLPTYLLRFQILGVPMTILELMILIVFVLALVMKKLSWSKIYHNKLFWPALTFLLFATVAIFTSAETIRALGIWKAYYVEPLLLFIVLISIIKTRADWQKIFVALGISAIYVSLISFWQYFSAIGVPAAFLKADGTVDRVVGFFGYPNALGLYLGPLIIIFTGLVFSSRAKKEKTFFGLAVLVSFITIVLAKSEGAIIAVIAVWLIMMLFNKKTRIISLLIILAGLLLFFFQPTINAYLSEKIFLQDYSGMIRRLIWQETINMLKNNWFFGAGLAGYQSAIVPYHAKTFEIYLYPHNLFLNFWSELGILGLINFLWLMIAATIISIKKYFSSSGTKKILTLTLAAIILEMFIHGLVDAPYLKNDLAVMFWLIMAMVTTTQTDQ